MVLIKLKSNSSTAIKKKINKYVRLKKDNLCLFQLFLKDQWQFF